jgi:predicted DNA-binding protein
MTISDNEKMISVVIPKQLYERVKKICDNRGCSLSAFGQVAIEERVIECETPAASIKTLNDLCEEPIHERKIIINPDPIYEPATPDWTKLFAKA